jgi:hypothetical protein
MSRIDRAKLIILDLFILASLVIAVIKLIRIEWF